MGEYVKGFRAVVKVQETAGNLLEETNGRGEEVRAVEEAQSSTARAAAGCWVLHWLERDESARSVAWALTNANPHQKASAEQPVNNSHRTKRAQPKWRRCRGAEGVLVGSVEPRNPGSAALNLDGCSRSRSRSWVRPRVLRLGCGRRVCLLACGRVGIGMERLQAIRRRWIRGPRSSKPSLESPVGHRPPVRRSQSAGSDASKNARPRPA